MAQGDTIISMLVIFSYTAWARQMILLQGWPSAWKLSGCGWGWTNFSSTLARWSSFGFWNPPGSGDFSTLTLKTVAFLLAKLVCKFAVFWTHSSAWWEVAAMARDPLTRFILCVNCALAWEALLIVIQTLVSPLAGLRQCICMMLPLKTTQCTTDPESNNGHSIGCPCYTFIMWAALVPIFFSGYSSSSWLLSLKPI